MNLADPGRYQATIVGQAYDRANSGTLCLYLRLRVTARYVTDDRTERCPPREGMYRQCLGNEVGFRILRDDLRALGVELDDLTRLDPDSPDRISLVGRAVDVRCEHEVYSGRTYERWAIVRPRARIDRAALQELNERFGHLLKPPDAAAKPPADPPADTPPTDPNLAN